MVKESLQSCGREGGEGITGPSAYAPSPPSVPGSCGPGSSQGFPGNGRGVTGSHTRCLCLCQTLCKHGPSDGCGARGPGSLPLQVCGLTSHKETSLEPPPPPVSF